MGKVWCLTGSLMIINHAIKTSGCGQPSETQQRSVKDETGDCSMAGLIKVEVDKVFIADNDHNFTIGLLLIGLIDKVTDQ